MMIQDKANRLLRADESQVASSPLSQAYKTIIVYSTLIASKYYQTFNQLANTISGQNSYLELTSFKEEL